MAWKPTGRPMVRRQRDKWVVRVVRVDGLDTETGKPRPRQLGTYKSRRAAQMAATEFAAAGDTGNDRNSVGFLVDQWVASRTDIASKTKMQYEWAAKHLRSGLGSIRVDRLDRSDVAQWLDELAAGGKMGRRSISIFRMVLRAALADAVDTGELRRSELLGLGWSAVDLKKGTVRIERALVEVHGRPEWSDGKHARSRRTIPIDPTMVKALTVHRRFQAEERLAAGAAWNDNGLVVATKHGNPVSPGNFDQTLERLVAAAGVPRLTSHGLRHTARRTWCAMPTTSARSVPLPTSLATVPTC